MGRRSQRHLGQSGRVRAESSGGRVIAAGHLKAWDCGTAPSTSVVNFEPGRARAGSTNIQVGADGRFCIRASAAAHVIVELTAAMTVDGSRATLTSYRAVDTRSGTPVGPQWRPLVPPLPAGVVGISAVVTMVGRGTPSDFVSILPCALVTSPDMAPPISAANGAEPVANLVQIATAGGLCGYAATARHVLVDVVALWGVGSLGYRPVVPTRVLDTRIGVAWTGPLGRGTWEDISIGLAVDGVAGTLTTVDAVGSGYAAAVACSTAEPTTSTVQLGAGAVAGATIIAGGLPCVYSSARAHAIFDVTGVFTP